MNAVHLIGRLTGSPEERETQSGRRLTRMRLAVPRRDKEAGAVFVDVVAWGPLGETCAKHLERGRQVAVMGRLETNEWLDSEGKRRHRNEVVADQVEFLRGG
jgi:single-strand DNA-binding protein